MGVGVLAGMLPCTGCGRSAALEGLEETEVYSAGRDGYHTYRIPALLVTAQGALLAFAEGRKNGPRDDGDIDLVLKRSKDGGRTWSAQQLVYEEGGAEEITIGNPSPVVDEETGVIWLPFCRNNDRVFVTRSADDGLTWTPPVDITENVKKPGWSWYATGPGVGIQLKRGPYKGRLVIANDHREVIDGLPVSVSHVFYSDDHGTWKLGGSIGRHTNECQVVELEDGSLMMNMRNLGERDGKDPSKGRKRAIALSRDGGDTWSEVTFDETLIEPVCQAAFLRYTTSEEHGRSRLLFSNPASRDTRERLTVRLSYDEGATWAVSRLLYGGPSAYSSLAVLPELAIGCLYERGRQNYRESIAFSRFSLDWLSDGADRIEAR
jgi:sialidase-1